MCASDPRSVAGGWRASVGRGRQSLSPRDGRSAGRVPEPPCPAPHLQRRLSLCGLGTTSLSDPQFWCFCVLMNSSRRTSQRGLGVDSLSARLDWRRAMLPSSPQGRSQSALGTTQRRAKVPRASKTSVGSH